MEHPKRIWFVLPAYNEAAVIAETLRPIVATGSNVVVVDDGSADDTRQLAHQCGTWICRHAVNLGQGAALQTGIEFALSHGAKYLVTFDADGQHLLSDAMAMVARLESGNVDIVLGSRFLGSTRGMSTLRGAILRLATWFTRVRTGLDVTDTHNGLRALTAKAAAAFCLRHNRVAHASEILDQIASRGLRFEEHPCTILYTAYSKQKGQRSSGLIDVLFDLYIGGMRR
ncbi:MAG TPA: glycosyltransferase family 2 protein [Pseudolabrys sp.]|nr:glycosyltransferase family 2 protein [Pseudolabrys sp.]